MVTKELFRRVFNWSAALREVLAYGLSLGWDLVYPFNGSVLKFHVTYFIVLSFEFIVLSRIIIF